MKRKQEISEYLKQIENFCHGSIDQFPKVNTSADHLIILALLNLNEYADEVVLREATTIIRKPISSRHLLSEFYPKLNGLKEMDENLKTLDKYHCE